MPVDSGNNPRCYSTYHSCADVKITSSGNGGNLTPEKCSQPIDWPYRYGQTILGGNVRTSRTAAPRRFYKNEIATWELRNGSSARHLADAPDRVHGKPDGAGGGEDGEGGGAAGKVFLWMFILGLAGGMFYVGYKKPEVVQKIRQKFTKGGEDAESRSSLPSNASSSGVSISGPTGVRKLSGHSPLPPGVTPPPGVGPPPPPVPSRQATPPKLQVHVERPKPPPIRARPNNGQVALT